MNINSTLILQGLHFGVAYVMLRKLLFNPVINLVRQEERHRHALESAILDRKAALIAKEQAVQEAWLAFQRYHKTSIPEVEQDRLTTPCKIPALVRPQIDSAQSRIITQEVAQELVQRIMHV